MTEKINKQEQVKRQGGLWIGLAAGLVLVVGLITMSGCSKDSANSSNAKPSPGTVVKNSGGMEFAYVPAGSFQMGSDKRERPVHQVTFVSGFYIGRYEVTQAQWQKVMGKNPALFSAKDCGENCPVSYISLNDAQEFIKKLNAQNDGYTYRLPSEAEWEYASRAGTTGDIAGDIDSLAWHSDNSNAKINPVGQKQPNAWGLYDMYGNVAEFTADNFHESYDGAPTDGSAWMSGGDSTRLAVRGGSINVRQFAITPTDRPWRVREAVTGYDGIRLVAVPQSK